MRGMNNVAYHSNKGWKQCGSIVVARSKDRMTSLKRACTFSKFASNYDYPIHVITASQSHGAGNSFVVSKGVS